MCPGRQKPAQCLDIRPDMVTFLSTWTCLRVVSSYLVFVSWHSQDKPLVFLPYTHSLHQNPPPNTPNGQFAPPPPTPREPLRLLVPPISMPSSTTPSATPTPFTDSRRHRPFSISHTASLSSYTTVPLKIPAIFRTWSISLENARSTVRNSLSMLGSKRLLEFSEYI